MERTTWQVKVVEDPDLIAANDFGDWEPFAVSDSGKLFVRKQTIIEDEKSSTRHELSFAERHERPYQDPDPED